MSCSPDNACSATKNSYGITNVLTCQNGYIIRTAEGPLYMRRLLLILLLFFVLPLGGVTAALASPTLSTTYSLAADGSQGELPFSPVIEGIDGYLYGTAEIGGANNLGVVYKVAQDGTGFQVLHAFAGGATDGANPQSGLVLAQDGKLYGTTKAGGANDVGTIYVIATDGTGFQLLHSFTAATDGSTPQSSLIQGADGYLYGTTYNAGPNYDGTLFRIATDGSQFYEMHSFTSGADGSNPGPVIQGSDGNLYGVTTLGGTNSNGIVYKIGTNAGHFTVVHSFVGADGSEPSGVFQATDGNLYGTTSDFATQSGKGTIFEVAPDGSSFSSLHSFTGADGQLPVSPLAEGTDGNLYGTASMGGANNVGSVFEIAQGGGGFSLLGSLDYALGDNPQSGLCLGDDGLFYGTAIGGNGTVFSLANGLSPAPGAILAVSQPGPPSYISVSWTPVEGAASYILYQSTVPGAAQNGEQNLLAGNGPNDVVYPSAGQTLYFQVTAVVNSNETAPSYEVSATAQTTPVAHTFRAGLSMISLPENYTTLSQAFGSASVSIATWSNGNYSVSPNPPANTMVAGTGYWARTSASTPAYDTGLYPDSTQPFSVALSPGWNEIANPMPDAVSAVNVQVQGGGNTYTFKNGNKAGYVGATFYTWQPTDTAYEVLPASTATLKPFYGYWLYAFKPCTLTFPAQPVP